MLHERRLLAFTLQIVSIVSTDINFGWQENEIHLIIESYTVLKNLLFSHNL